MMRPCRVFCCAGGNLVRNSRLLRGRFSREDREFWNAARGGRGGVTTTAVSSSLSTTRENTSSSSSSSGLAAPSSTSSSIIPQQQQQQEVKAPFSSYSTATPPSHGYGHAYNTAADDPSYHDPYDIRGRFNHFHVSNFETALVELRQYASNRHRRHSSRLPFDIQYMFPVGPFVVNGREKGNLTQTRLVLRNSLDSVDADQAMLAFLRHTIPAADSSSFAGRTSNPGTHNAIPRKSNDTIGEGSSVEVSLRDHYIRALKEIESLLADGYTLTDICGPFHARMVYKSAVSFRQAIEGEMRRKNIETKKKTKHDYELQKYEQKDTTGVAGNVARSSTLHKASEEDYFSEVLLLTTRFTERMIEMAQTDGWQDFSMTYENLRSF